MLSKERIEQLVGFEIRKETFYNVAFRYDYEGKLEMTLQGKEAEYPTNTSDFAIEYEDEPEHTHKLKTFVKDNVEIRIILTHLGGE